MKDAINVDAEFNNVTLLNSMWIIHGLNLIMAKANLSKTQFHMEKRFHEYQGKFINISNSTFGSLIASNGYEITISDSNIDSTTILRNTLVDIANSSLNIVNSGFYELRSNIVPVVIKAVTSQVKVQDVKVSESSSSSAFLQVQYHSELTVAKCTFKSNKYSTIISVTFDSSASIKNSIFSRNNASSILYGDNSSVFINNSSFVDNHHPSSSVIYSTKLSQLRSIFSCFECEFINNNCSDFGGTFSDVSFSKCTFTNLVTPIYITAIKFNQANAEISRCTFSGRPIIDVLGGSTVYITNSSFNYSQMGSISIELSTLNITYSTIQCEFHCINRVTNSAVVVAHSHFYRCGILSRVTACFSSTSSSNLDVSDTVFEYVDSQVVMAQERNHITFTNCLFQATGGFSALRTNISITNSTIMHSYVSHLLSESQAFIELSDRCYLHIYDSNITHNNLTTGRPFVNINTKSTMTMLNCLYARNIMSHHLVASKNTHVSVADCQFVNNEVINDGQIYIGIVKTDYSNIVINNSHFFRNTGNVLTFIHSTINVQGSSFNHNIFDYADNLITAEFSHSVNFTNSLFRHNVVLSVLYVSSEEVLPHSYLQLYNCSFKYNQVFGVAVEARYLVDVIFDKVSDQSWEDDEGISVECVKTVRIQDSMFSGGLDFQFYFLCDTFSLFPQCSTKLLTLQSNFSNTKGTLETNTIHFLNKAKSMGVIDFEDDITVRQEETKYASSKQKSQYQLHVSL